MTNLTTKEKEEIFYSEKLYHSYSSLSKLMYSPALFYKDYVLKETEPAIGKHLIEGKLIHSLMLDKSNFDDLFIIAPSGLPSDNTLKVINVVYKAHLERKEEIESIADWENLTLSEYTECILDALIDMDLHQSLKTDEQRINKIINEVSNDYWLFLNKKQNREIIDMDMLVKCEEFAEKLKNNEQVTKLLLNHDVISNELLLKLEIPNSLLGLKGILDNLGINHEDKTIYINDLKTSNKPLKDFPESVEFWNYWLQAVIYKKLVEETCSDYIKKGYKIVFNFIVIDLYKQVYCFEVSDTTYDLWISKYNDLIKEAEWHFSNRNYTLPYKLLISKFTL